MNDFQQLLSLLGREGETIRIARGDASTFKTYLVEWFNLPQLDGSSDWNFWFELNPSLYNEPKGRSSAQHVTRLTALYADLDYVDKPGGKGLADLATAYKVINDLSNALGTPPAAIVHTGHGVQPYWPVDGASITDINRNDTALLLTRWGIFVQNIARANGGTADSVFDLPRILRMPGGINIKNPDLHVPTSVQFINDWQAVDTEQVGDLLDEYNIHGELAEVSGDTVSPAADWEWAEQSCHFYQVATQEIATSIPSARHPWALKYAAIIYGMVRDECVTEADFNALMATFRGRFEWLLQNEGTARPVGQYEFSQILKFGRNKAETWSAQKLADELRQHTHGDITTAFQSLTGQAPPNPAPSAPTPTHNDATISSIFTRRTVPSTTTNDMTQGALALDIDRRSGERILGATFTDTGNAEQLAHALKANFICVPDVGWHLWDGATWKLDSQGRVMEATKDLFVQLLNTAPDEAHRKWAHGSLSAGKLKAALELTKTVPFINVEAFDLDNKGYELNTPAGVVNLRTGELRPANPLTDRHTKVTGFAPAHMPTPLFDAFLLWALGDRPRIEYLQRVFGIAAIGKLLANLFPIFLGIGGNGKSVLLSIIIGCLGNYGTVMPQKFLIQKNGDTHPTEIAQLKGLRLVVVNEVPPNAKFDEELIKTLTGEPRLRARYMGENFFEFENTCTPILLANHLPQVVVGGTSFWRRARKMDFENVVLKQDENVNLVDEILAAEGPGILQWIIDGAVAFLTSGERPPEKVTIATKQYQLEEDVLARFFDETLTDMPGVSTSREGAFDLYKAWTVRQAVTAWPFIRFCREIIAMRPGTNVGNKNEFVGITLQAQMWGAEE